MESLQKLLVEAHLLPKEQAEERLIELDSETANCLLEFARSEKMFPFLYETLSKSCSLQESHHQFAENLRSAREAIDLLLEKMQEEMGDVEYLVVKGKGIEAYYPAHLSRHYLDIDMSVRDLDAFWMIANFLLRHDFEQITTMRFFTEPDTQQVHGYARFDPVDETGSHKVEIQIGAYMIECGYISRSFVHWDDFSQTNGDPKDLSTLKVPNRQGNILIYFAELMSRERFLIRDLFDIYFLTQDGSDINVSELLEQVRKYHLQASVFRLYHSFREHPELGIPPLIEQMYQSLGAPKSDRYRFVTQHLFPYLRERHSSFLLSAALLSFRVLTDRWNSQERYQSILKWTDLHWNPQLFFRRGIPIFFAKINDLETAQLTFREYHGYSFALTPIGSFAVSLHASLSDEMMDLLHEHIVREVDETQVI